MTPMDAIVWAFVIGATGALVMIVVAVWEYRR